jgi:hypothetical protein
VVRFGSALFGAVRGSGRLCVSVRFMLRCGFGLVWLFDLGCGICFSSSGSAIQFAIHAFWAGPAVRFDSVRDVLIHAALFETVRGSGRFCVAIVAVQFMRFGLEVWVLDLGCSTREWSRFMQNIWFGLVRVVMVCDSCGYVRGSSGWSGNVR